MEQDQIDMFFRPGLVRIFRIYRRFNDLPFLWPDGMSCGNWPSSGLGIYIFTNSMAVEESRLPSKA